MKKKWARELKPIKVFFFLTGKRKGGGLKKKTGKAKPFLKRKKLNFSPKSPPQKGFFPPFGKRKKMGGKTLKRRDNRKPPKNWVKKKENNNLKKNFFFFPKK